MILEKQTEATILQEGQSQDSIGMSLDLDSAQILMQMLSKNLYSDNIGSTIRECASNALDSHRRAQVDKPIIVAFKVNDDGNYEFTVEDFGIGLDADDVRNIISKYGKSTKRNSNTELGMMGLGFKAPLAYSSSFYFICRKDGVERKYMMYEGEDVNTIDLLFEKPTTECNGVKIIVPVNYYDKHSFISKINEQLAYFENVYFDCEGYIDNEFVINRSEHFQYSELAKDGNLHLCLDNVYYPLDFNKLGIDRIAFPVALRLSLSDGVFPTPNRESLRYTKESIAVILGKIEHLADYYVDKYNAENESTMDIHEVFRYYQDNKRYVRLAEEGSKLLEITQLEKLTDKKLIEPKIDGINYLSSRQTYELKTHFLSEYETQFTLQHCRYSTVKGYYYDRNLDIGRVKSDNYVYYIYSDTLKGVKKEWLRETMNRKTYFIKKTKPFSLGSIRNQTISDYTTYFSILKLWKYPKEEWRAVIKEFQYLVSLFTASFVDLDKIEVPQSYIDGRKKQKVSVTSTGVSVKRVKLQGEITCKRLESLERYVQGKNSKQVSKTYQLNTLHKYGKLIIYGTAEKADLMDKLFTVVNSKKVDLVLFSERELKNLQNVSLHNLISIDKFMEGKNKMFKRIVTAKLIDEFIIKYRSVFNNIEMMDKVSSEIYNTCAMLEKYKDEHHRRGDDSIYKAMLEVAHEQNLFDGEVYPEYKRISELFEKLPFLDNIFKCISYKSLDLSPIICDLFKYHKQRINWKNYKLNEEVVPEEQLSNENVEELVAEL